MCTPKGSRFFRFGIQILRNIGASEVGVPLLDWCAIREMLDPPLLNLLEKILKALNVDVMAIPEMI